MCSPSEGKEDEEEYSMLWSEESLRTGDREDVIVHPNNFIGVSLSSDILIFASEAEIDLMVCVLFFNRRCETRVYICIRSMGLVWMDQTEPHREKKVGKMTHQERKGPVEMREPHVCWQ